MRVLITAGPTREAIDPVRYLGNRSSGKMGAAVAQACLSMGHGVTLILGPVTIPFPSAATRFDIESAADMHAAVLREFPRHDLLIMAAAVADYRPRHVSPTKLSRAAGALTLELEPTEDIAASASTIRQAHQRIIGFSLERAGDIARARQKLLTKRLDLIVFNPLSTMNSESVEAILLYPDGRSDKVPYGSKAQFADILLNRAVALFR
jgi:phosphopantothenoylcysteine decarboxylase / phosphopantothenate---cysteine ligase